MIFIQQPDQEKFGETYLLETYLGRSPSETLIVSICEQMRQNAIDRGELADYFGLDPDFKEQGGAEPSGRKVELKTYPNRVKMRAIGKKFYVSMRKTPADAIPGGTYIENPHGQRVRIKLRAKTASVSGNLANGLHPEHLPISYCNWINSNGDIISTHDTSNLLYTGFTLHGDSTVRSTGFNFAQLVNMESDAWRAFSEETGLAGTKIADAETLAEYMTATDKLPESWKNLSTHDLKTKITGVLKRWR